MALIWPTKSHKINSGFGYRVLNGNVEVHDGLDISKEGGTDLFAVADGTVTEATNGHGYGNYVSLDIGGGITAFYGHLASIKVKNGQRVKQGDVIGIMGTTGYSTGVHLHFSLVVSDSYAKKYTQITIANKSMLASDNSSKQASCCTWRWCVNPLPYLNGSIDIGKSDEIKSVTITLPSGLGSVFTYMGWQLITSTTSTQYKLREAAGMNFNSEGFGIINGRYVVAMTTTFGSIGDFVDVYQSDGHVFQCVIGDIKNQSDAGCNKWGHSNGKNVLEFVVNKNTWYNPDHANPGTSSCHPEWGGKTITKVVNTGFNYFTNAYGAGTSFNLEKKSVDNIPDFNKAEKAKIIRNWKNTQGLLLKVIHENTIYDISNLIADSVQLTTKRRGTPAKLTFKVARDVVKSGSFEFYEGDAVALMYNETDMFWGYVFSKERTKDQIITVTAYDQTRYLKTKETYCYSSTATEIIKTICDDYNLQVGELADTGYMIQNRIEDTQSLLDIIYNALDLTNIYTGNAFVFYDDFGDITLKSYEELSKELYIISENNELIDFKFKTDIDTNTYNRIVLYRDNEDTNTREVYIAQDSISEMKYGILQYTEKVSDNYSEGQIQGLANKMLEIYNNVNKTFTVEHSGIPQIRAGMPIFVQISDVGEVMYRSCIIESCTHTFKDNEHTMQLELNCNNDVIAKEE